jgi:hypothetical protein
MGAVRVKSAVEPAHSKRKTLRSKARSCAADLSHAQDNAAHFGINPLKECIALIGALSGVGLFVRRRFLI